MWPRPVDEQWAVDTMIADLRQLLPVSSWQLFVETSVESRTVTNIQLKAFTTSFWNSEELRPACTCYGRLSRSQNGLQLDVLLPNGVERTHFNHPER